MKSRTRFWLAAALGSCLGQPGNMQAAEPPARLGLGNDPLPVSPSSNQATANAIAANLRQSGVLRKFNIEINYRDGTAELTGTVADQSQREEARRIVQGVPGVDRVMDRLSLAGAIVRVQAEDAKPDPLARPKVGPNQVPVDEPQPEFSAPAPQPSDLNPPRMPPYAWPTYAPYNNYSRVAYPQAYPYNAWPYIGPIYPFPKVPLGWRSVKLEWDDGYWWFSRTANKHDWWKLRYW